MKKLLSLLLVFTLVFSMSTSVLVAADTPKDDKVKLKSDIEKLLAKYNSRILSEEEIKELGFDKTKFKEMEQSIDLVELEKLIIARQAEMKDVTYADYSEILEEISPSLAAPNSLASVSSYTYQQTITKTFYKTGSFYSSNPLGVRYQVSATYTQDVTVLPGAPNKISNKNFTSWSQGEVVQTDGSPYHRVSSYYSGVSKYSNTALHHTGGFTSDNYIGVDVDGFEVLIFTGTSSATFSVYHTI